MWRECVVLVMVCVCAGSYSGKGFFCRDPDTGKLHSANTSWTATSFCGKYHCKIKKRNITGIQYAPHREINITNVQLLGKNLTAVDLQKDDMFAKKDGAVKIVVHSDQKAEPDITHGLTLQEGQGIKIEDNIDDLNISEQDRYLSDKEIRSLTDILHTVKKADLEAIVEIYNLAQDIYKEMDKTTTDSALKEVLSTTESKNKNEFTSDKYKKVTKHDHVSYWIKHENSVNSPLPEIGNGIEEPAAGVVRTGSKTTKTSLPPTSLSYFNGPLSNRDFGKLPYFYPISNFQRVSSYTHEQKKSVTSSLGTRLPAPKTTLDTVVYRPIYSGKYQKELRPSMFLPYPFTNIHHYNWSFPQHMNYANIFEKVKTRRKDGYHNGIENHVNKPYNAVLMNPYLENFQDLEIKASEKEKVVVDPNEKLKSRGERRKPDWQTDPLPSHVLDEVRAHIQEKQRLFIHPFPLRKKVKLERVAKVLNMDKLVRSKRSEEENLVLPKEEAPEPELYEVFIEKITCNADYSVPGYFRYGNLSEPYPACCPQRIPLNEPILILNNNLYS